MQSLVERLPFVNKVDTLDDAKSERALLERIEVGEASPSGPATSQTIRDERNGVYGIVQEDGAGNSAQGSAANVFKHKLTECLASDFSSVKPKESMKRAYVVAIEEIRKKIQTNELPKDAMASASIIHPFTHDGKNMVAIGHTGAGRVYRKKPGENRKLIAFDTDDADIDNPFAAKSHAIEIGLNESIIITSRGVNRGLLDNQMDLFKMMGALQIPNLKKAAKEIRKTGKGLESDKAVLLARFLSTETKSDRVVAALKNTPLVHTAVERMSRKRRSAELAGHIVAQAHVAHPVSVPIPVPVTAPVAQAEPRPVFAPPVPPIFTSMPAQAAEMPTVSPIGWRRDRGVTDTDRSRVGSRVAPGGRRERGTKRWIALGLLVGAAAIAAAAVEGCFNDDPSPNGGALTAHPKATATSTPTASPTPTRTHNPKFRPIPKINVQQPHIEIEPTSKPHVAWKPHKLYIERGGSIEGEIHQWGHKLAGFNNFTGTDAHKVYAKLHPRIGDRFIKIYNHPGKDFYKVRGDVRLSKPGRARFQSKTVERLVRHEIVRVSHHIN